jgi:hypothetical protein
MPSSDELMRQEAALAEQIQRRRAKEREQRSSDADELPALETELTQLRVAIRAARADSSDAGAARTRRWPSATWDAGAARTRRWPTSTSH